jgi:hypothetical protein
MRRIVGSAVAAMIIPAIVSSWDCERSTPPWLAVGGFTLRTLSVGAVSWYAHPLTALMIDAAVSHAFALSVIPLGTMLFVPGAMLMLVACMPGASCREAHRFEELERAETVSKS